MKRYHTPQLSRRALLACATALAIATPTWSVAQTAATSYPTRPVRLIVPFTPGGGSDMQARMVADHLRQIWTQPVVVENVPGAGGSIAAANVARSQPDGHTILFANHPILAVNPFVYNKLPYKVSDFTPVVTLIDSPLVLLVNTSSPLRSVADVIKAAKASPGTLNYGSGGIATTQHLTMELFRQRAGIDLTLIPYKGNAQTNTALLAGEIQMFFDSVPSAIAQIKGGRMRGIAVSSTARVSVLPDVPAISETLPGFSSSLTYGLLVPSDTPKDTVMALNRDVNKVLKDSKYVARMAAEGATIQGGTPEQFADFLARERAQWEPLAKRLNLKLD